MPPLFYPHTKLIKKNKYYSLTAHEATSCLHPNPETMTASSSQDNQCRAILGKIKKKKPTTQMQK